MAGKTRLALIFGGQSSEHAVSLESAKNVMDALDAGKYDTHLIAIDRKGVWRYIADKEVLRKTDVTKPIDVEKAGPQCFMIPSAEGVQVMETQSGQKRGIVDVAFPILHGPYGEDGTMQGYLRLMGLPFVGSGVLGSAVGMDKDVAKRLLRDAGLPIGNFITLHRHSSSASDFARLKRELGLPFFLKPANMGSSVGVHKVSAENQFAAALTDAFQFDRKVIVEEFIDGREIECAVLGNEEPTTSNPGEVLPKHEFYSYEAKYLDANGATFEIPAKLDEDVIAEVQEMAIEVYETLCCEGMSRVDFFLKKDGSLYVNEVNTIPGFTKISMYPKMMAESGVPYSELIDQLVEFAMKRTKEERGLKV